MEMEEMVGRRSDFFFVLFPLDSKHLRLSSCEI